MKQSYNTHEHLNVRKNSLCVQLKETHHSLATLLKYNLGHHLLKSEIYRKVTF